MKHFFFSILFLAFGFFSSFKITEACEYAGSNIGYVQTQTERAINIDDINRARYYTYKALNGIEKSKGQLSECGCDYALSNIEEGLDNLKKATRATSLNATRILLNRALENILGSLEALEEHELHGKQFRSDVLAMNTIDTNKAKMALKTIDVKTLHQKIDDSLMEYEESLNSIVNTVNCKEALAYAKKVYEHCEIQLLKPNLSEGKKYYNLRTKKITSKAIKRLEACHQ